MTDKKARKKSRWDWDSIPMGLVIIAVTPGIFWLGVFGMLSNGQPNMSDTVAATNAIVLFGISIAACVISLLLFVMAAVYVLKSLLEDEEGGDQ